jgi:peptidoglycan/LPS O-acetylase OafA/YrhL
VALAVEERLREPRPSPPGPHLSGPSPALPRRGQRQRALDGIRAIAIALVFAEHFGGFLPGTVGVDVFFVLSGYLITGLLIAERERSGRVSFRAFYRRRALRLMPAYLVTLGLTVIAASAIAGDQSGSLVRQGLARSLTYTSNIGTAFHRWDAESPRLWEFTWSLAAEEQFYLVWPVLLVIGLRLARSDHARLVLAGVTLGGFLASAAWSYHLAAEHAAVMRISVAPDTRSGALLIGCAVAIWQSVPWAARLAPWAVAMSRWGGLALATVLLWRFPRDDAYAQAFLSPVMAVATALVIVAVTTPTQRRSSLAGALLSLRPMALVGKLSYSLYLYNVLALLLFDCAEQQGWIRVQHPYRPVVAALLALALATVSYRCVEQPFLRRRDRRLRVATTVAR